MNTPILLLLTFATVAPTAVAFADDGTNASSETTAVSASTATEFVPMTKSERLRYYLLGLASGESVFRAASSGAIRQAENSPKEWGGGAEGYGFRVGDAFAQHVLRGTLQYGASAVLSPPGSQCRKLSTWSRDLFDLPTDSKHLNRWRLCCQYLCAAGEPSEANLKIGDKRNEMVVEGRTTRRNRCAYSRHVPALACVGRSELLVYN